MAVVSTPLPVLPQITVETGLVTGSPTQVSTALRLDDATFGKLDTATLGTGTTWSAIPPQLVLGFTITRPSTRLQGPLWNYQAGTVNILCDNSDGSLDPDNLSGPYVLAGVTQLAPMVPVRVRASIFGTAYPLYSGFADGWLPAQVTYEGGYAELTLPATDAFKILAGITLPATSVEGVGADTGARVRDILSRAGWYTSAERLAISTGNSTLQGTTLGADALSLMQVAVDSEIGQLYVSGSGAVVFRARRDLLTDTRSNTVQAVFGDLPGTVHSAGTELAAASLTRANDDTTIANDIQATRAGSTSLQEAQDAASIAKYQFPRTYPRTDLILQNDSDALNWAQWVLSVSRGAEDRFETITIDPQADPANLWPQVLGREIGDRIQVWHRPAGFGGPLNANSLAAGSSAGWTGWQGTFSVTSSPPAGAPYPYAGLFTITSAGAGAAAEESGQSFPVAASRGYQVAAWVYTAAGSVTIGFDWTGAGGGYLSTSTQAITVPAGTWTRVSTPLLTSDPAAAFAYPRIAPADGAGNSIYLTGVAAGSPISKDCFIAGITHAFDPRAQGESPMWLTTFSLQDASKYGSFLTLDNATLGQLDSNALTF